MINQNLLLTGDDGYNLTKSLRFRSSASAYLNRTPASAGNTQKFTFSAWVKRGILSSGSNYRIFQATDTSSGAYEGFEFAGDTFTVRYHNGSFVTVQTSAVLRDPSAWYHLVGAIDTTDATSSNRIKLYINGVQQTTTGTQPAQNYSFPINDAVPQAIASYPTGGEYFDGYMAEVNLVDGQALTPSSFGSTNALTGVWQPAKYTGTYGTNGFYLPFTNTTSTSTLGNDFSGNSNTWTVNNISLTTGSTYDSMTDVPTLTSATVANYATFNPLIPPPTSTVSATYSNGNLTATCSSAGNDSVCWATMGIPSSSGLWYWEITTSSQNTPAMVGIAENNGKRPVGGSDAAVRGVYSGGGQTSSVAYNGSMGTAYSPGFQNTTVGVALDMTNGAIYISVNGTYLNSGVPTSGASKTGAIFTDILSALPATGWIPSNYAYNGTVLNGNYGQRPFAYTPPTGFVALNTFNLPTSTIVAGNKQMNATTYTGNGTGLGSTQTISNGNFQPDLIWIKSRSTADYHNLNDSVRGIVGTGSPNLFSNTTDAETTFTGYGVSAVTSTGFTLIGNGSYTNVNGQTYVGWQWKAGNSAGSSNTNGSITSTVSVNATAGFSVVTYTGTGTNGATVGHGLGVAPTMMIIKTRSAVNSWVVYHQSLGNTKAIYLNLTSAADTNSSFWNNTSPTSSVLTLGTDTICNQNGTTYVAYCWTPIAGYSAFGSYTGNGSADGPFVYTGFRPRFVMWKNSSAAQAWLIEDTARSTYNEVALELYPSSSGAEAAGSSRSPTQQFDFLSNGFKVRGAQEQTNGSGNTIIYMAFAENPFKNALAR